MNYNQNYTDDTDEGKWAIQLTLKSKKKIDLEFKKKMKIYHSMNNIQNSLYWDSFSIKQ